MSRPRSSWIDRAERFVERSEVLPVLEAHLDAPTGRPRFLSVRALLVAMMLNGLEDQHQATITRITAMLDAMPRHRLAQLGCLVDRWPTDLYKRVDDLVVRLFHLLDGEQTAQIDGTEVTIDHVWFSNRIGASPVTDEMITTRSVAIDGTAIETPARLEKGSDEVVHDGPSAGSQAVDAHGRALDDDRRPKARLLGLGIHDRRKVWTKDFDARGGHRSTTSRRKGGLYVGYELHGFIMARDVTWTNGIDKASLSPPIPSVILNHALVPAGTHRGDAVVPLLTDPKLRRAPVDDVIVDPGYTTLKPHRFFTPLHRAGIHVTWQVTSHNTKVEPFNDNAFVYNGHLISETLPAKLRNLPQAPIGADAATRADYQQKWNQVARYRLAPHGRPDSNGTTRFRDPIAAGRLRSPDVPSSMRRSRSLPTVRLPEPGTWEATVRATAEQLPRWSKYLTGTTAHETAYYSRRNVTESAHSALRGDFMDLDTRHFRVFGLTRINTLLGFTIAGYNQRRIAAFAAAHGAPDPNADASAAADTALAPASGHNTAPTASDLDSSATASGSDPPA